MGNKVLYYSTDKLYKITKNKISKDTLMIICLIVTFIFLLGTAICLTKSTTFNAPASDVKYNELGKVDYKVYLKDNNYYDTSYLKSGMQYVASLIKTVNVKFNYQFHSTKNIDFNTKYKVVGKLIITERDDPTKVLYTRTDNLIKQKTINKTDDNFTIDEEVDIDYAHYNNIVNSYKKDLGLIVSSNLVLTLETDTYGKYKNEELNKDNKLQITIPLSEATLNIKMDANEINNTGSLGNRMRLIRVDNLPLFLVTLMLLVITLFLIIIDIYIYIKYIKKDVYKHKVNRILKDYDRLIVHGSANIHESNYPNKFYPKSFKEMVDVAQNFNVPILFYEVIPGEKCFFIVAKDDILYKYRLTKAFLEKDPTNNNEDGEYLFDDKPNNEKTSQ